MSETSAKVLVLGGTTEARALTRLIDRAGIDGVLSLAGRVARPAPQSLPMRMGGFGGAEGLAAYLRAEGITHVVDGTHPFAAQMSRNAHAACHETGTPLLALTRAPWVPGDGDNWLHVPDMAGAVAALDRPATRVFLAVGRMHLAEFAAQAQHDYLLRLVDPPEGALPLPKAEAVIDRGPFTEEADLALMQRHGTRLVVSKNAGGSASRAKLLAARRLGLPVVMIDRPALPERPEAHSPEEVLRWLGHVTDLGV